MHKVLYAVILMFIFVLGGCSNKTEETAMNQEKESITENDKCTTENDNIKETTSQINEQEESKKEQSQENKEEQNVVSSNGIRADFKEAMDAYENFCDEYVAFMKEYKNDATNLELVGKYSEMLKALAEMEDNYSSWEQSDLNTKELQYYIDVQARVSKKMLEVGM